MPTSDGDRDGQAGLDVEGRVRAAAAEMGVPDFVYYPLHHMRGGAQKEVGDGFLICGEHGALLQVKSRGASVAQSDTGQQARRWARRELKAAVKQARGSRELARLIRTTRAVTLRPLRSREVAADRRHESDFDLTLDPSSWPLIVVLDHVCLPPLEAQLDDDIFVITRSDWDQMMSAVRSVAGVIEYVRRCLASRSVYEPPIGVEWSRFLAVCAADGSTDDGSAAWGPWLSPAALMDRDAADWYQHLIDRSWPAGSPLPAVPPADHRVITEFLDQVPPDTRVKVGAKLRKYAKSTADGGQAGGLAIMPEKAIFLMLHHSPRAELDPEAMAARLSLIAAVRWWEIARAVGSRPVLAVGAFVHPGATDYVFVLIDEPVEPGPIITAAVHEDVGVLQVSQNGFDHLRAGIAERVSAGRPPDGGNDVADLLEDVVIE